MKLGVVVEGHGEVAALPILLRSVLANLGRYDVTILKPIRQKRDRLASASFQDLERGIALAVLNGADAVLVVCDSDSACAATLGPSMNARALANSAVPVSVVLAVAEFESWLLAAVESLKNHQLVRGDASFLDDPDEVNNPKAYLERRILVDGSHYSETVDQPSLTAALDVGLARSRSRSFDKLWREVELLVKV